MSQPDSSDQETKPRVASNSQRVYLSAPDMGADERRLLLEAFDSNWIAPLGPNVTAFEEEFAAKVGASGALALSSGTAALHLALRLLDVAPDDEVLVSDLTFVASANAVRYTGARPVFIDSDQSSWNMSPGLLADALRVRASRGRLPAAVIVVHLYGQPADIDPIMAACEQHCVPLIEDAAESLGAEYRGRPTGVFGDFAIFSFNGNKIITTSGGGMLVGKDATAIDRARRLSAQARDPAPHYQHSELGYNYRMSNLLAAVGRGQLRTLEAKVERRRRNFARYRDRLADLPGITFMPEAPGRLHTRWLTTLTIDPAAFGTDRESVRLALEAENIESRPVWKPMHMQPLYAPFEMVGGEVSEALFRDGLCLPSGSSLRDRDLDRVADIVRSLAR